MNSTLASFTDVLDDEIGDSQPISLSSSIGSNPATNNNINKTDELTKVRPIKGTGQHGNFRSIEEIDPKYRDVFSYPYFNLVQSNVIDDALYTDKSIVVCAPTGSGKTVVFEMAIVQLLMELEDKHYNDDFKIIYMAPVKALCTERLSEWYQKFTKLGLLCIEATGDTDVDFTQLKPYNIIITTPEKWDMLTRRWRDHRSLVEVIKLFLIDEVHILNDQSRGPVLEAVVSRMKTIESSAQSVHRIELLQNQLHGTELSHKTAPSIRFVAVSATVSNPEDVANWLGTTSKPAVFHKFGDECRPVKLRRIVEGYPWQEGSSIFKFDIMLNYKLWPIIQKYHSGKPTLIFCNTRKSVVLTAETLARELTINFSAEQKAKLTALASTIKTKSLQTLVLNGVGCHHAGLLYEERQTIELAFRNRDLPILITTTTLAMGVNLPAHLVIIKNTQQYVNGGFQEYSISTVLQMVGRAGRPQFDTEATAVIMTRLADKARYQALVGGCEPLQSYLHKRLPENLNSEAALGTVGDVAQCVQWLRSTFLYVRAARDPKKYLNLPLNSPQHLISKKIEELCVRAMNSLASSGLITMDEACCIESTEAGRLMSVFYLDLETMKQLMKIEGTESLERLLQLICESHELSEMHLRVDERRCLNALNRNNAAATIRFPMKGKITTRQMKLNCIIQAVLGCLSIPDPSLNQEAMKIMRIVQRICKCLVAYVTRPDLISCQPQFYSAVLNSIILAKCTEARLWENSPFVSKQLKGIGPTFSTLLATAGKVNFMLLEESHPRDLERIMNKGPPAGNVIRKQVSLLPKYQLSMIPIDEMSVTLQLELLNQNYLSENIEQLTAGSSHKSYIIVGDSNNHILLLASFKDKDLISVFDGTLSYEIRRKHNSEHKIFAHCISTTIVGIDAQSEYLFNDLNPFFGTPSAKSNLINNAQTTGTTYKESNIKPVKKQTCITDTFKERKRKNVVVADETQSKEKRKRDNAIIQSFKYLKKTFETASKNVKEITNLPNISYELPTKDNITPEKNIVQNDTHDDELVSINNEPNVDNDDFIDNEKVNRILNEIEMEMNKNKDSSRYANGQSSYSKQIGEHVAPIQTKINRYNTSCTKRKPENKSNYSFIELLERNLDLSDDDKEANVPEKDNGFSDTIKSQINKYIQRQEKKANTPDTNVHLLIDDDDKIKSEGEKEISIVNSEIENLPLTQKLYPNDDIGNEIETNLTSPQKLHKQQSNNESCYNAIIQPETNFHVVKDNCQPNIESSAGLCITKGDFNEDRNPKDLCNVMIPVNNNNMAVQTKKSLHTLGKDLNRFIAIKIDKNELVSKPLANVVIAELEGEQNNNQITIKNVQDDPYTFVDSEDLRIVRFQNPSNIIKLFPNNYDKEITAAYKQTDNNEYTLTQENNKSYENKVSQICRIDDVLKKDRDLCIPHNADTLILQTNIDPIKSSNLVINANDVQPIIMDHAKKPNCTNNYHDVNKNAGMTQNYSYTASKVDYCAKETPEYSVKIIKKIKVDLNITKIISNKKTPPKDMTNRVDESTIKNIHQTKNMNPYKQAYETSHQNIGRYEVPLMCLKEFENEIIRKDNENDNIRKENDNMQSEIGKDNIIRQENENDNIEKEKGDDNIQKENEDNNIQKETENDTIWQATEYNQCAQISNNLLIDDTHESLGTGDRNENAVGNDKIKSILQKFSKILGKDDSKSKSPAGSTINRYIACTKSITPKTNKPFKITDIQKQPTSIPETIVDSNKHAVEHFAPSFTKFVDSKPARQENGQSDHNVPIYSNNPKASLSHLFNTHNTAEIDESMNISTDIDTESDAEVNIDQTMFDPKTLLRATINADISEVIPPPWPFCDDLSQHSNNDNNIINEEMNSDNKYNEYDVSEYIANTDRYHNTNLFEDKSITYLTPSREIETWTLDQEDCWGDKNNELLTPAKSFTVVRSSTSKCRGSSETSGNVESFSSRRRTLGQFKFNHKHTLKKQK